MPNLLSDTPAALDTAIAAGRQAHREKLVRAVRNQEIRMRVAIALSGCIAALALAALWWARDREAAAVLALIACITGGISYLAGQAGLKKAFASLRDMDAAM